MTPPSTEVVVRRVASELGVLQSDGGFAAIDSLNLVDFVIALEQALGVSLFTLKFGHKDFLSVTSVLALVSRAARPEAATEDTSAEQQLVELISGFSDPELTAHLAEWSQVMLDPVATSKLSNVLTGRRRELFGRLMAQHRIDAHPGQPLARRSSSTAPITLSQQQQWDFHRRGNLPLSDQASAYVIRGHLDVPTMQRAVATLVKRHAALRTVFRLEGGRVTQTVRDHGPELDVVDLSRCGTDERATRARELFSTISQPYDLGHGACRAQLVRLDDHEHLLFVGAHHIVVDAFSWRLIEMDLAAIYRAYATGQEPTLSRLEFQFADFCSGKRHSPSDRSASSNSTSGSARSRATRAWSSLPIDGRCSEAPSAGRSTRTRQA